MNLRLFRVYLLHAKSWKMFGVTVTFKPTKIRGSALWRQKRYPALERGKERGMAYTPTLGREDQIVKHQNILGSWRCFGSRPQYFP